MAESPDSVSEKAMTQQQDPGKKNVNESRRRFTRAGLAVSGAILTLKSAPVLAGKPSGTPTGITYHACESPSGFTSANVSAPGQTPPQCGGLSPGGWAEWPTYWPTGYLPGTCKQYSNGQYPNCLDWDPKTGTSFHASTGRNLPIGFPGFSGSKFGDASMMAVIANQFQSLDSQELGRHCAASVLNVAKGLVPTTVLTIPVILDMWTATANGGYYEPTAGVHWYAGDVVNYLKTTFG